VHSSNGTSYMFTRRKFYVHACVWSCFLQGHIAVGSTQRVGETNIPAHFFKMCGHCYNLQCLQLYCRVLCHDANRKIMLNINFIFLFNVVYYTFLQHRGVNSRGLLQYGLDLHNETKEPY
jgi:hypothetical protein